jgi:hypothetical protein
MLEDHRKTLVGHAQLGTHPGRHQAEGLNKSWITSRLASKRRPRNDARLHRTTQLTS